MHIWDGHGDLLEEWSLRIHLWMGASDMLAGIIGVKQRMKEAHAFMNTGVLDQGVAHQNG